MKQSVFVLFGNTGNYGVHNEWVVAVHTNKDNAWQHAKLCKQYADDNYKGGIARKDELRCPYDPEQWIDYGGISYTVYEIPLVAHVDEFIEEWTKE